MKLVHLAWVTAALLAFTGASVWEGAVAVAPSGDLPEKGLYVATNSFPRNTVVDITNLENDKSVRVIVAGGLETPGLLAVLSGNAAALIGLRNGAVGRVRMTQPSDPIAFSRFTEGMATYGDEAVWVPMTEESAYAPPPSPSTDPAPFIGQKNPVEKVVTDSDSPPAYALESEWNELPGTTMSEPRSPDVPLPIGAGYDYTLIPAEERPPESPAESIINPEHIIPGIAASQTEKKPEYVADLPVEIREPPAQKREYPVQIRESPPPEVREPPPPETREPLPPPPQSSSIPVISSLERGKYYIQIGAFSKRELIEAAINRIHENYPLAIQNAGTEGKPLYRILLGPLNLGESGAMLQRVKSIGYKDAFVRSIK